MNLFLRLLCLLVPFCASAEILIPKGAPEACTRFIRETLPATWSGGFIKAPLDWNRPVGKNNPLINVFYYYDNTRNLETSQPILFLRGGPFGHAQPNVQALDNKVQEFDVNKNHVFVIIDQRGTGCSFPLMRKPLPGTEDELNAINLDIVRLHSSDDIVRDAEFLRTTLFKNKKWKLFGQSFGGTIIHRYIHDFPEAIHSAHAHAPTVHSSWTEFARRRLAAQQEVYLRFIRHYDQVTQRSIDFMLSPEGNKICISEKGLAPKLCGKPLLDAILGDIGQGPSMTSAAKDDFSNWDSVNKKLSFIVEKNYDAFKAEAEKSLDSFFRNDRSLIAFVSWSQEMAMHPDLNRNCTEAYSLLRAEGLEPRAFPLDECRIIRNAIPTTVKAKIARDFKAGTVLISQKKLWQTFVPQKTKFPTTFTRASWIFMPRLPPSPT